MLTVKHYKEKVKILEKFFLQFMKNVFVKIKYLEKRSTIAGPLPVLLNWWMCGIAA